MEQEVLGMDIKLCTCNDCENYKKPPPGGLTLDEKSWECIYGMTPDDKGGCPAFESRINCTFEEDLNG